MSALASDDTPESDAESEPAPMAADVEQVPGITVVPPTFRLVAFDATEIAEIAASLRGRVGLPAGLPIRIEVNELTPLGRAQLVSVEPAVMTVESGGIENAHRPRHMSKKNATELLGRLLLRLRDRLDPAFGDPPDEDDLSMALSTAWDVYSMARLERLGQPVQRPRWQYHYRLRHGFSDAADAAFAQVWAAESLTWAELERLSRSATG
jgi:hypothetical protein